MRKCFLLLLVFPLFQASVSYSQDHRSAGVSFGGVEIHLGMSEAEALAKLSECCILAPPSGSIIDNSPVPDGQIAGHFVLSKNEANQQMLGNIWFKGHKVVNVSRELAEGVDSSDENVVSFARALKRSLPEVATTALVKVRHEQAPNAESDLVTLVFPSGKSLEIRIVTLDKDANARRDSVSFEEVLRSTE